VYLEGAEPDEAQTALEELAVFLNARAIQRG
jgi:hypothetical protein